MAILSMERKITKHIDDASVQKFNMYMYEHSNYLQKVLVKRMLKGIKCDFILLYYFLVFIAITT